MSRYYVIAGGSSGIGRELVRLLEPQAEQIHIYSRTAGDLQANGRICHHGFDFLQDQVVLPDLPEIIHGVAYCPGSINLRSFRSLKPADFRADFELNVLGAVKFLQACWPGLQRGSDASPSSAVLFSTVAAQLGMPMHASIAAAKGALEGLTRALAAEGAPHIRVNCIAAALTETPLAARLLRTPAQRDAMAAKYPLHRIGVPSDIASAARYLLSDEATWITGQIWGIDGGMGALHSGG